MMYKRETVNVCEVEIGPFQSLCNAILHVATKVALDIRPLFSQKAFSTGNSILKPNSLYKKGSM